MKKYPSYIDSLISELQSSEFANDILQRYQKYSTDPILSKLFEHLSGSGNEFFHSSKALSLISSMRQATGLNDAFALTFYDHHIDVLVPGEDLGISPIFLPQESSLSTLWSQTTHETKSHKTLKQLSFEVKQFILQKGNCTYKEVADEIVGKDVNMNEKNIRRRVYDAINVLTAVGVFEKKGKQVCIVEENLNLKKSLCKKKELLKKLVIKYQKLFGVIWRNMASPNYREAVQLPFSIVLLKKNVKVI